MIHRIVNIYVIYCYYCANQCYYLSHNPCYVHRTVAVLTNLNTDETAEKDVKLFRLPLTQTTHRMVGRQMQCCCICIGCFDSEYMIVLRMKCGGQVLDLSVS